MNLKEQKQELRKAIDELMDVEVKDYKNDKTWLILKPAFVNFISRVTDYFDTLEARDKKHLERIAELEKRINEASKMMLYKDLDDGELYAIRIHAGDNSEDVTVALVELNDE